MNLTQKASESDQEIPKSHTADQPTAPLHKLFKSGLKPKLSFSI